MATVTESIDLAVPVTTAYNQWTQFEEFPSFMEGIREVRQLDDVHMHWVAEVGGKFEEWDAEITEQRPDTCVAWRSTSGKQNSGMVRFEELGADQTRITVQIDHEPEGMVESVGAALGADDRRVKRDLERFREMIEARGTETGAWRGQVSAGQTDTAERDTGMSGTSGLDAGTGGTAARGAGGLDTGMGGTGASGAGGLDTGMTDDRSGRTDPPAVSGMD